MPVNQIENIKQPTGTAIAADKGVDGFELIMRHGHAHQWVNLIMVLEKRFPAGESWRRVVSPAGEWC